MFEYSGSIHMHSRFSDGSGTVEEIVNAANEVDLDFIILTDHNTMKAKEEGYEKWHNNTLLIVGYEVNDRKNRNHYVALGTDTVKGSFEKLPDGDTGSVKTASEYVRDVKEAGGFGFIAHPFEKREKFPSHPPYPWTDWDCDEYDGIEIWNHMSEWTEGLTDENKFNRFLHPLKSIVAPEETAVKLWDEKNMERKVVAIGSIDAHAFKQNVMGFEFEIFPYKILFKSIRTHVFVDQELKRGDNESMVESKTAILDALREGRSFIANYYHGDAKGFRFIAEYDGKIYNMGDEILFDKKGGKKITFKTYVPQKAKIKFIKNGKVVDELTDFNSIWDSDEEGNYRLEVWVNGKAWIFSNHIKVKAV
ncbi:MAG: PHP domain-containing protein [Ignavibacteriae bacterium]|nr:PHP domain-containing protein [Ignavibacteriota bacterium]MCB9242667.1 PHP domain-containing protein [Ignavibacteriales bacterium]